MTILGVLSIFAGHEEDLVLGFLILVVSLINIIFVTGNNSDSRIKYANSILGLNVIGGILFLGTIFVINDFFDGEFFIILLFTALLTLYVGVNVLYILSTKNQSKITLVLSSLFNFIRQNKIYFIIGTLIIVWLLFSFLPKQKCLNDIYMRGDNYYIDGQNEKFKTRNDALDYCMAQRWDF
jgi:hypothetical protein